MAVSLSALRPSRPFPPRRFLILISVRGWVNLKVIVRLEGWGQLKNPVTSWCNESSWLNTFKVQVFFSNVIRAYFEVRDYVVEKIGWKFYIPWTMKKLGSCHVAGSKNIWVIEIYGHCQMFSSMSMKYSTKFERRRVIRARHLNEFIECPAGSQTSQSCGKGRGLNDSQTPVSYGQGRMGQERLSSDPYPWKEGQSNRRKLRVQEVPDSILGTERLSWLMVFPQSLQENDERVLQSTPLTSFKIFPNPSFTVTSSFSAL
jgi:hypothetical protein